MDRRRLLLTQPLGKLRLHAEVTTLGSDGQRLLPAVARLYGNPATMHHNDTPTAQAGSKKCTQ